MLQDFLRSAFSALPAAASSPLALAAYVVAVIAWVIVVWRVKRNKHLLANLDKLPENKRLDVLRLEMGVVNLKSGLSPEQYVRSRIHLYYLIGFGMICVLILLLFAISSSISKKKEGEASVDITLSQEKPGNNESAAAMELPPSDSIDFGVQSHLQKDSYASTAKKTPLSEVRYVYERSEDKVFIKPIVPYLSWVENGGVIEGSGVSLSQVYPELSIKVVNNTDETIYLTEVAVNIKSSSINKEPLVAVSEETWDDLHIYNKGWGQIINPQLSFGVADAKDCAKLDPRSRPTKHSITVDSFSESMEVSMKPYVYVPPLIEQKGNVTIMRSESNTHACIYGKLAYETEDSAKRAVNFRTTLWVGTLGVEEYGSTLKATARYEVALEALSIKAGEPGYTKRIPISQYIKPGDVDHFTILVIPNKSAEFNLSFDFVKANGEKLHSRDVILNTFVPRYWKELEVAEIKMLK